jgi:polyprenyl-phospho-N-acetylgalactosaminyl synthase
MNKDVVVVVPVKNQASTVGSIVNQLSNYFSNIVCVDDGSVDSSIWQVSKTPAKLVRQAGSFGYASAVRTGITYALAHPNCRYVLTFDPSGAYDPVDALKMTQHIRSHQVETVFGSRTLEGSGARLLDRYLLKLEAVRLNRLSSLSLSDSFNGLFIMSRDIAAHLDASLGKVVTPVDLLRLVNSRGHDYAEVPIIVRTLPLATKQPVWQQLVSNLRGLLERRELRKQM